MKPFILALIILVGGTAVALADDWLDAIEAFQTYEHEEAIAILTPLAADGHTDAQITLGIIYADGNGGIEVNHEVSFSWFSKAAELGEMQAQYLIGSGYSTGLGVQQDYEKSHLWLGRSAQQGYARAQEMYATNFRLGKGASKDLNKAIFWYKQALINGNRRASYQLGSIFSLMQYNRLDYIESYKWFKIGNIKGYLNYNSNSLIRLASLMSEEDINIAENLAHEWLSAY